MNYIKEAVTKKYAQFSGRARRKEYWTYTLVVFIISLIAGLIDDFIIKKAIISTIITLALIVPSFAIAVRRLHDIGKGGRLGIYLPYSYCWSYLVLGINGNTG